MIPAVGEHPGVAVLRLHYSKPCFALTAVVCAETAYVCMLVCMLMCLRVCVCVWSFVRPAAGRKWSPLRQCKAHALGNGNSTANGRAVCEHSRVANR